MATSSSYTLRDQITRAIQVLAKEESTGNKMDNGEVTSTCPETSESFQFPEDNFTDVSLLVEGQQLFTNRSLLAFASPVFSCMFTAEFKEKSEKVDVNI